MLKPGEDYSDLGECYVIFITENDVIGMDKPIYRVERHIKECDCLPFNDGEHIIYVNGKVKASDTALGRLMNDFFCTDAKDMHYKELSDKVRYYKETEEGVETMCKAMDDMRDELKQKLARKMIERGELSLEDIADYSELPLEKVKELAENKTA